MSTWLGGRRQRDTSQFTFKSWGEYTAEYEKWQIVKNVNMNSSEPNCFPFKAETWGQGP